MDSEEDFGDEDDTDREEDSEDETGGDSHEEEESKVEEKDCEEDVEDEDDERDTEDDTGDTDSEDGENSDDDARGDVEEENSDDDAGGDVEEENGDDDARGDVEEENGGKGKQEQSAALGDNDTRVVNNSAVKASSKMADVFAGGSSFTFFGTSTPDAGEAVVFSRVVKHVLVGITVNTAFFMDGVSLLVNISSCLFEMASIFLFVEL